MRRRELIAGVGSLGVLAGAAGIVLGGVPSFGNERSASSSDGDSGLPVEIETIDARGSEAGTVAVPNGDVTVVMFFVTGCGTCQGQMPRLAEAHSRLVDTHGDGLTVLSATYQSKDMMPTDELRTWWRDHSGNWTVGYDPQSSLAANYGVAGFPVTIVIDRQGEKRWEKLGVVRSDDIVAAVESVIETSERRTSNATNETDAGASPTTNATTDG
ncbi:TlpA family protein disulfide reductase [Natrinema caseinilyticum]|uniref:TlpA family protein disulfide reductase n=1 Tax=Natrinema caseinilyticum TaxID=2961570 RepID=UPI0020C51487|nr:TlpA disulfide reductase family protein [Natrinema caseinilyticum]